MARTGKRISAVLAVVLVAGVVSFVLAQSGTRSALKEFHPKQLKPVVLEPMPPLKSGFGLT